ncbi:putative RNA-directed DNA polymerase, eukaryota, reverse transcriptase zinc-binding domain protein [Tanacetum coccineum]
MGDSEWQKVTRKSRRSVFDRLKFSQNSKSNMDDLAKISLTVYVSNFPSHLTVRELWNICRKKGTIVDVFIAKHKNIRGQMFAFCRFIKVSNKEALIDALSNIWIGKLRMHANLARFDRKATTKTPHVGVNKPYVNLRPVEKPSKTTSYANCCKSFLLGCYKDFRAIANARIMCRNEGFLDVGIKYLGGLWVVPLRAWQMTPYSNGSKVGRGCFFFVVMIVMAAIDSANAFVSNPLIIWDKDLSEGEDYLDMHDDKKEDIPDNNDVESVVGDDMENIKWALEGDENSNFFHGSLKRRRRQLAISGIFKNGEWMEDPSSVKEEFFDHFRNRFNIPKGFPTSLNVDMPNPISLAQREFLEHHCSREEIKKAVWDCGGDRAPGPDGFTFKFITSFWDLLEADVVRFVDEFFHSGKFPKGCNSSFISLIPKVPNAKFVSDFRPISLIGCQHKIIGKILANRLSSVIGSCISPEQTAFIKGRNILDGPLILNEIISWYHKRKKELMIFKVDFEKAFDSVRWDFLDLVMDKLGFGSKWRSWIHGCLKEGRSSVLVNGSPTSEFELFKGLRQGDPLSPFLFILVMEALHATIRKTMDLGLFKGVSVGHANLIVSHLMYADDVIFLGEWSESNVRNLLCMLRCFYLVSGLKINVHKSNIIGVSVSNEIVNSMAKIIGCGVANFPLKYLGIPVGCNMSCCVHWNPIIQKFSSKLAHWKARLLSVGGRLFLIKSVLGSSRMNRAVGYVRYWLMHVTLVVDTIAVLVGSRLMSTVSEDVIVAPFVLRRSFLDGVGGETLLWVHIWNSFATALLFTVNPPPPKKAVLWDNIVSQSFLWISSRNPKLKFSWVAAVFRRSPEFAPSDRHDFWTEASLHIKEGFDRWDLDFEAWKFCFLPGQIASCLVIFFLSCSLFVAIYLDIDSKIMMIVVCL